ncbi:hypothetical protein CGCFRS4_v005028 [Colletotrichum fructicola]|nr:hypothetical protein CGCFRS4_v005028 [Colletotrichum fructicola]
MTTSAKANGLRQLLQLHSPPRGTPSRVHAARLRRCLQRHQTLHTVASTARASPEQPSPIVSSPARRYSQASTLREVFEPSKKPTKDGILNKLLSAVQSQKTMDIFMELKALGTHDEPYKVMEALIALPATAFSELVRSLDPFRIAPRADVTNGFRISRALGYFSPVASLDNEFGVRKLYYNTLQLIRSVLDLRQKQGRDLTLSDYIVLLRCAGAASDIETAKAIWKQSREGGQNKTASSGLAYNEFMKARFLTEPIYMQRDLARVRMRPRDLTGHRKRFAKKKLLYRLDRLRLNIFAHQRSYYGRSPNQPTHDLHRVLSLHQPIRRTYSAVKKKRLTVDRDILSTYFIACGRAGSLRELLRQLWSTWRISLTDFKNHRDTDIVGGVLDRGLLFRPNLRVMNALVDALGCTGHVILARKLMIFLSHKYQVPIPPETWSLLLEWTHVIASKPASTEYKILGDSNRIVAPEDVLDVWHMMVSGEHGWSATPVEPEFKDFDIYVKNLIASRQVERAREEMRRGVAMYESACQDVETALFERLYRSAPPEAVTRHMRAKVKQHITWFAIEAWCWTWLETSSKLHRSNEAFSSRTIPAFVAEFKEFLPNPATYKTSGGTVRLETPQNSMRHSWTLQVTRSPPTALRVPDRTKPKHTHLGDGEAQEGAERPLIPVVMESGKQLYETTTIRLNRWTKEMVRKRTDRVFGQLEKGLTYADEGVVDEDHEAFGRALNEEAWRIQKSGLKKRLVLRSLLW